MKTEYTRWRECFDNYAKNNRSQRYGQQLMNALYQFDPSFYHEISGDEMYDCFYDDRKVPAFLFKLYEFIGYPRLNY